MNSYFNLLGIESWKPVLTALMLPPVPLLLLVLIGARLLAARRAFGGFWVTLGVVLLWLSATTGAADLVAHLGVREYPPLGAERIKELRAEGARKPFAIVVLGGGVEALAPEYGMSSLQSASLERLRYGLWLSRQTNAPVGFSGGVGHAQTSAPSEAEVAQRIATQEFGRPLRWVESESRDTRENAGRTVALLRPTGIEHIVLVTHHLHMPRAVRAFAEAGGGRLRVEPAPIALAKNTELPVLRWLPSNAGFQQMRYALREMAGRWAGA